MTVCVCVCVNVHAMCGNVPAVCVCVCVNVHALCMNVHVVCVIVKLFITNLRVLRKILRPKVGGRVGVGVTGGSAILRD